MWRDSRFISFFSGDGIQGNLAHHLFPHNLSTSAPDGNENTFKESKSQLDPEVVDDRRVKFLPLVGNPFS